MRRAARRAAPDGGAAIVIGLLITLLTFLIATAVLAQAIHNVNQSGYGRRRLAAVNAAEAGLNWYVDYVNSKGLKELSGTDWEWSDAAGGWYETAIERDAATYPEPARFIVRAMYSTTNPCFDPATKKDKFCEMTTGSKLATIPLGFDTLYARVQSIGSVGQSASAIRTLESFIRLRPQRSSVSSGLVAYSVCMTGKGTSKIQVEGDLAVEFQPEPWPSNPAGTALCPVSTNLTVKSGGELKILPQNGQGGSLVISGGGLDVDSAGKFSAVSVWAERSIKLGGDGSDPALSCPESDASQCVAGDLKAPTVTFGTKAFYGGSKTLCTSPCPPLTYFPRYVWDPTQWVGWASGSATSVTDLFNKMQLADEDTVFYIGGKSDGLTGPKDADGLYPCDVRFTSVVLRLKAKIGVVSYCRFIFEKSGAVLTGPGSLLLISASPPPTLEDPDPDADCTQESATYGSRQDVVITNNQTFELPLYIYTPCVLRVENNQDTGSPLPVLAQFAAKFLYIKNSVRLSYRDIATYVKIIPGEVAWFQADLKFVQEIPSA